MFSALSGIKKFLAAAAASCIAAAIALGGYFAAVKYAETNWRVLAESRRELIRLEKRRAAISEAGRTFPDLERERGIIQGAFVDPLQPLPLIESIEALGRRDRVKTELALASTPEGRRGEEYALSAQGSFRDIMPFLAHLESLPFLVEIRDAEFERIAQAAASKNPPPASIAMSATIRIIRR